MTRPRWLALLLALSLASVARVATGTPDGAPGSDVLPPADHLGGSFTACGRISAFTAPVVGTPGSLTVEGVVDFGPHSFPIDEAATVDPLLPGLAAAGDWTCLDVVGDGGGVLTSLAAPSSTNQCGIVQAVDGGGMLGQAAGSTHDLTTIALDGDAAALIGADTDLLDLLSALAAAKSDPIILGTAEACLNLTFAGDGTLASVALDYDLFSDQGAAIACGQVDGTAIEYRDPTSQPYPEAGTVSVDGFELDALPFHPADLSILSFHLDAGLDICLLARVVDTAIVDAGIITGGTPGGRQVCGKLEVVGGQVFVDRVLVGHGLMALDSAEPTPSSIDSACASVGAQWHGASSELDICGDFQGVGQNTVLVSGVTLHFAAPVLWGGAQPQIGGPQPIGIFSPFLLAPFDEDNYALVGQGFPPVCTGELPDSEMAPSSGRSLAVLMWLALTALLGIGLLVRRAASTR